MLEQQLPRPQSQVRCRGTEQQQAPAVQAVTSGELSTAIQLTLAEATAKDDRIQLNSVRVSHFGGATNVNRLSDPYCTLRPVDIRIGHIEHVYLGAPVRRRGQKIGTVAG